MAEAQQNALQAQFILHELQANIQVYGSNNALMCSNPANVGLALQYINRSLECAPDVPDFLNTKALLLAEGMGQKEEAIKLLEKAHAINPRDITIESNLNGLKSSGCFIATAAFGSPLVSEINTLRVWRKEVLLPTLMGRLFVRSYNRLSPPIADAISKNHFAKTTVRFILRKLVAHLSKKHPAERIWEYRSKI
tara:strand:- start:11 stop:592 length:582 start_codon:yes stop_codon:yes gene_type:complete